MKNSFKYILPVLFFFMPLFASAQAIKVTDDAGVKIELKQPAQRVISLSPHITELLYAAGANEKIIAAVDYSNYPREAESLPRVGSGYQLDLEAITGLKPDLIVGWKSGNNPAQLEQLKKMGFKLYLSEPKNLRGIAKNLRDLGALLENKVNADQQADDFLAELEKLETENNSKIKPKVFYQVWDKPLFTVNGKHMISRVIELCGGENIFKELTTLSPQVDIESIIARNPQLIIAGLSKERENWLNDWKKWTSIDAVKNNQLYCIDADLIVRQTPRILLGARKMCEQIAQARELQRSR
jgi:iron complex transport system substrate-binding protein